jgi:hypothetical protein
VIVLYLARDDEPERHRGTVFSLERSVFAPSESALRFVRPGAFHVGTWRLVYTDELRALWRRDPEAFLTLIELASGGNDLTLVDGWGDEDYAPRRRHPPRRVRREGTRRILAAVLKQIARTRRDEARRRARRSRPQPRPAGGQGVERVHRGERREAS